MAVESDYLEVELKARQLDLGDVHVLIHRSHLGERRTNEFGWTKELPSYPISNTFIQLHPIDHATESCQTWQLIH